MTVMPALPSKQPVAARQNRLSTSPTRRDPYSSTNGMGGNNYNDRGGYREVNLNFKILYLHNIIYRMLRQKMPKIFFQRVRIVNFFVK